MFPIKYPSTTEDVSNELHQCDTIADIIFYLSDYDTPVLANFRELIKLTYHWRIVNNQVVNAKNIPVNMHAIKVAAFTSVWSLF